MRDQPASHRSAHGRVQHAVDAARQGTQHAAETLGEQFHHAYDEAKPRLRGWLHAVTSPLTVAAGIVLIALSPDAVTRIGSVVFTLTAVLLFTVSAVYHRGTWSPRVWAFLRRFDHANIFLLIAGSYTPFALLLLDGGTRALLLGLVWGGATLGVLFRIFWTDAPRWLYTPIYIALGWAAIFFADDFAGAGPAVLALVVAGGVLYTAGGIVYGLKRPNPSPSWFGFHEVFHALTVAAFITHYVGVSIVTYSA